MVLGSDLRRGNARRGSGPRAAGRGTALAAALALLLAPALVACSDYNGGSSEKTPSRTTSAPAATAPADPAAAEQEIKQNWEKFFDPKTSLEEKQNLLEHGDRMGPVLRAFSGDERGAQVQAKVEKVEFTSATGANVTYTLLLKGATALPNASGTSVDEDGTWKVSVRVLCALIQMSGDASRSPVPGC
ncbi:hypothetical protein [Streptomyces griseus]|uniref:hypothetical protein n=1 Tax=Streptomyces griseus TaxID=1911 RepID=UPI00055DD293|nr:hypothetical protein [Streptomyces griseus]